MRSSPSEPPSHTTPRESTKSELTSPTRPSPTAASGFQEASPFAATASRPTTGILPPSVNGLSNATQTAPLESRLETAKAVDLGAAASRRGAFHAGVCSSAPLFVKTTTESLTLATPPWPVSGRSLSCVRRMGGTALSEPRGTRNAPRETVPIQMFPLSSSTRVFGISGRCAKSAVSISPPAPGENRSMSKPLARRKLLGSVSERRKRNTLVLEEKI